MLALALAALLAGSQKGADPCDVRCNDSVKVCEKQCEKMGPKPQSDVCKSGCKAAVPSCKEACKKPVEDK